MYIDLSRSFREIRFTEATDDSAHITESNTSVGLSEILQHRMSVILAEGGAGKTQELKQACRRLNEDGHAAFFCRLEHIGRGFDRALHPGDVDKFEEWKRGSAPGWFLLDSIDESRLRSTLDFEAALTEIARELHRVLHRAHVVLSGRPSAWRPQSDRLLCKELFFPDENIGVDENSSIRIFELEILTQDQVETFAQAKGVAETKQFLDAIERGDAWLHAQRPQDLDDLVEYWRKNGKLGSRQDWMIAAIERRLHETQNRAEARPLGIEKAREGAEQLAAALILTRLQNIRVQDGPIPGLGLKANAVLDWDEAEITTLLQRPLFSPDIYGTVRFHHRSVLECMAAMWFCKKLHQDVSRRRVEELLFREQYGLQVVVPSLRTVTAWLANKDNRVLETLLKVSPEVLFEGGDPRALPVEIRHNVLEKVCEHTAKGTAAVGVADQNAILRFAAPDLGEAVRTLAAKYRDNNDVLAFLMRVVWHGEIGLLRIEAMEIAQSPHASTFARVAALLATEAIGTSDDLLELRSSFSEEAGELDRSYMGYQLGLVTKPDAQALEWVFKCLPKLSAYAQNESTGLTRQLAMFFERAEVSICESAIGVLSTLLHETPTVSESSSWLSLKYRWLMEPASAVLSRLIKAQSPTALEQCALAVLDGLASADAYGRNHHYLREVDLLQLVQSWPTLKWAWFWQIIARLRSDSDDLLVDAPWMAWTSMHPVTWVRGDFSIAVEAISRRELQEDKLVALNIAYHLYRQFELSPDELRQLSSATEDNKALHDRLEQLNSPPVMDEATKLALVKLNEGRQQFQIRQERKRLQRDEQVQRLKAEAHTLREHMLGAPSSISNDQAFLLEEMRGLENDNGSRWTQGRWQLLEAEFGAGTAQAFRDGMVSFWRKHEPKLISEKKVPMEYPLEDLFGLAGLTIEVSETEGLIASLKPAEAGLAFRYALCEINGFPMWFDDLCTFHPEVVTSMAMRELEFELKTRDPMAKYPSVIADVRRTGPKLANLLAPQLLQLLEDHSATDSNCLEDYIAVLMVSEVPSQNIAALASKKLGGDFQPLKPLWAAALTSVDSDKGIKSVEQILDSLARQEERTEFMMAYAASLLGSFSRKSWMRTEYQKAGALQRLYLLIHRHVRADEDIDRVGRGVYTPELRDAAQEARERIVQILTDIPSRDAFLALEAIASEHPQPSWRPWFVQKAIAKAQLDSERAPWSESQVREFSQRFERAPKDHRELFDLAVMRLLDLKHELEEGDHSIAKTVKRIEDETELRNFIAAWCSRSANGRFAIPQEHELPDGKRPDLRWICTGIEGAVPTELKIADKNWTGPKLFERLENQLAGDYLRDEGSRRGIFLLVRRGTKQWEMPDGSSLNFDQLVEALQQHWKKVSVTHSQIEEIKVIGIDLTKRDGTPAAP